jgi:hypothetical protein
MISKRYPVEKIEEVVWQLKKYYDDRARYYKNFSTDLMYHMDRLDNQDYEQQDLVDTTADDQTLKKQKRMPVE